MVGLIVKTRLNTIMSQPDYMDYYDWRLGYGIGIEDWGLGLEIWIWDLALGSGIGIGD